MEKVMVVPLRKARRGSRTGFAPKALKYLKEFVARHMKTNEVVIGPALNEYVWSKGRKNPPRRAEVRAKIKDGKAYAELGTIDKKAWAKFVGEETKPAKKKTTEKKEIKKPETKKTEKKSTAKKTEKKTESKKKTETKKEVKKKTITKKPAAKKTPAKKTSTKKTSAKK